MFFLIFLVGVGTHYIYRGMDLFGFWIFGWILGGFCGMKEIKKSASPKKTAPVGVGVGQRGWGHWRGGRKILRPYKWVE